MMQKRTLDIACGSRMMHFDKQNPDVLFCDKRRETHVLSDGRVLEISPDVQCDFSKLPFPDNSFALCVMDVPHLRFAGPKSWLRAKYGVLASDWQDTLRAAFAEAFRVLDADAGGVLIFKWNQDQIKIRDVLSCTPVKPLFGHPTGRKGLTIWCTFLKPREVT